ncbi:MAG: hypothetical protein K8H86_04540 [Ignavibacteriaceae bacterium]|nr:hypothetical protein [Ignavibacteriaceae bacterium]
MITKESTVDFLPAIAKPCRLKIMPDFLLNEKTFNDGKNRREVITAELYKA